MVGIICMEMWGLIYTQPVMRSSSRLNCSSISLTACRLLFSGANTSTHAHPQNLSRYFPFVPTLWWWWWWGAHLFHHRGHFNTFQAEWWEWVVRQNLLYYTRPSSFLLLFLLLHLLHLLFISKMGKQKVPSAGVVVLSIQFPHSSCYSSPIEKVPILLFNTLKTSGESK